MTTETQSYFEIAFQLPPGAEVTFSDVGWDEYEQLLEQVGEAAGLRLSYNDGTLKIMTLSTEHESYAQFIESLITVIRLRLKMAIRSFGSATMRKQKSRKGGEPDACFYVQSVSAIGNRMQLDFATDPPPDIVAEVDIQHDSRDKFPIYAALGVPEIWRYDGAQLSMYELSGDRYSEVEQSLALPVLSSAALTRFLALLRRDGESQTLAAFDEWLQSHNR